MRRVPDLNYSINSSPPMERCACGYLLVGTESGRCPECGRSLSSGQGPPIASYRERRFGVRRDFALYRDRIMCLHKTKAGTGTWQPILLEDLSPDPTTVWERGPGFKQAWLPLATGMVIGIKGEIWHLPTSFTLPEFYLAVICLITGLIMLALTYRLVEIVRFGSTRGSPRCLLEIRKQGPDESQFDAFIAAIKPRINKREDAGDWVSLVPKKS